MAPALLPLKHLLGCTQENSPGTQHPPVRREARGWLGAGLAAAGWVGLWPWYIQRHSRFRIRGQITFALQLSP